MNTHAVEKKASAAKEFVRRVVCGTPLAEMRRQFSKATKKDTKSWPFAGILTASVGLLLMAIAFAHALYQVKLDPGNPGWYALVWAYGSLGAILGGFLLHKIPTSSTSLFLLFCTVLLGFLAVPFTAGLVLDANLVIAIIATPFAAAFIIVLNHYARRVQLHNEGYRV